MATRDVRDDWLLPTLEGLLPRETLDQLKSLAPESYWEASVRRAFISDEEVLTAPAG